MVWMDVFPVITNLFFLLPFAAGLEIKEFILAWSAFLMVWVSGAYHLCGSFGVCLFRYQTHFYADFFMAQYLIVLMALHMIFFPKRAAWMKMGLSVLGAVGIAVSLIIAPPSITIQAIIVGISFGCVIVYWVIQASVVDDWTKLPRYEWVYLGFAVAMFCSSLSLFLTQNKWMQAYWALHSLWHTASAFGLFFFIYIKKQRVFIRKRKYNH